MALLEFGKHGSELELAALILVFRAAGFLGLVVFCLVLMNVGISEEINLPCKKITTQCQCGPYQESLISVDVQSCPISNNVTGESECQPCHDVEKICSKFKACKSCLPDRCHDCPNGKTGTFCDGIATDDDDDTSYPIEIVIPAGSSPGTNRTRRSSDLKECDVPSDLKTAEVRCWIWPSWTHCHEHCISGYKLPDTTKRDMSCRHSEDIWKPAGFEECKPYVNCDVKLVTPGTVWCRLNTMSPTKCRINCLPYGNKPAVPTEEYVCDGHFDPHLPHCVEKGSHSDASESEDAVSEE